MHRIPEPELYPTAAVKEMFYISLICGPSTLSVDSLLGGNNCFCVLHSVLYWLNPHRQASFVRSFIHSFIHSYQVYYASMGAAITRQTPHVSE